MFAKGFLLFTAPERLWQLNSGPGEKGRTLAEEEAPCPVLAAAGLPLEEPASLRARFLLILMISAGRLKLGEYPAGSDMFKNIKAV